MRTPQSNVGPLVNLQLRRFLQARTNLPQTAGSLMWLNCNPALRPIRAVRRANTIRAIDKLFRRHASLAASGRAIAHRMELTATPGVSHCGDEKQGTPRRASARSVRPPHVLCIPRTGCRRRWGFDAKLAEAVMNRRSPARPRLISQQHDPIAGRSGRAGFRVTRMAAGLHL
jgi:hypothetical protein